MPIYLEHSLIKHVPDIGRKHFQTCARRQGLTSYVHIAKVVEYLDRALARRPFLDPILPLQCFTHALLWTGYTQRRVRS